MKIETLTALDTFRDMLSYNPWHFWQLSSAQFARATSDCNTVLAEYAWQRNDAIGRQDINLAIGSAENMLETYLGFPIAPKFITDTLNYTMPDFYNRYSSIPTIKLNNGYVQSFGAETYESVTTGAIVLSDSNGDGINDTFTVTIATALDETELGIYVPEANRFGIDTEISEIWRIRPVKVTRSGNNVIFTGPIWLIVKPNLYDASYNNIDPTVSTNYLSEVEVYRRYANSELSFTMLWDYAPYPWFCSCESISGDPAAIATAIGRVSIQDPKLGIVTPVQSVLVDGSWRANPFNCNNCRPPDRIMINYVAGYPLNRGLIDPVMLNAAFRLTLAEIARPLCACEKANKERSQWQDDLTDSDRTVPIEDLINPLGQRRGHLAAWQTIKRFAIAQGTASN